MECFLHGIDIYSQSVMCTLTGLLANRGYVRKLGGIHVYSQAQEMPHGRSGVDFSFQRIFRHAVFFSKIVEQKLPEKELQACFRKR